MFVRAPISGNVFYSLGIFSRRSLPYSISRSPSFQRLFSTDFKCSQCKANVLGETVVSFYQQRDLARLKEMINCHSISKAGRLESVNSNCRLVQELKKIALLVLDGFPDVLYIGNQQLVSVDCLKERPEGDLGDLTGDQGKQVAKFIQYCSNNKYMGEVGSIIDVGGQNTLTVDRVCSSLGKEDLPSLIVEINALTPGVSKERPTIKYAIGDVNSFFLSDQYLSYVKGLVNEKPTLLIFNNILNVLTPEEGWQALWSAWNRLRVGDYLVISGLTPEQLERHGVQRAHELDGIIQYCEGNKKFYKSALSGYFSNYLQSKLVASDILVEEVFNFMIEVRQKEKTIEVEGRRILSVRKSA